MTVLHIDIETFSECDLKKGGLYKYAEHPSTELIAVCYSFDEESVKVWVPFKVIHSLQVLTANEVCTRVKKKYGYYPEVTFGEEVPAQIRYHVESGKQIRAHNAQFERRNLNGSAGRKVKFPNVRIEQTVCTAAKMAAHGLPRALDDAAKALGSSAKDSDGVNDMRYLCKPKKDGGRCLVKDEPERYISLFVYCVGDVLAERGVDHLVPDLSPHEQLVYELDQRINDRGIRIDQVAIDYVQKLIDEYKEYLAKKCRKMTGLNPSQTGALADWCRDNGYLELENMQAETVKAAVKDPNCPDDVKTVLKLYSTHNMKAVTKYKAMIRAVCDDGRLHGMFLYHGANTGRWSSTIVQLQNLFRPVIDDPETAIEAFSAGDLDWIRSLYNGTDPMKVFASCVRGMLIAGEGKDLLFPDYSGIEARVNAWLWGEEWKLKAFRAYDGKTGPDLYKIAYSRAFGIPIESVTKAQRQIGKVMELALGYEGGVGAFLKMAETYGMNVADLVEAAYPTLPQDVLMEAYDAWEFAVKQKRTQDLDMRSWVTLDSLKRLWRRAHPKIVSGWAELKEACGLAVQNPGQVYKVAGGKIMFKVQGQWLYMRLPSGRRLAYFRPSWDAKDKKVRYMGIDTFTRRYCRTSTYGGKLDENAVQAIARDILVHGLFHLEAAGYWVIGTVHDEAITEIDEGFGSFEHAGELLCDLATYAEGLPVAVEGHRAKRYRK